MVWADYQGDFNNAEDPSLPIPDGIYSVRSKAASTGKTRDNRDYCKISLKITGPGRIGRMVFIDRYPDKDGDLAAMKSDFKIMGGGTPKVTPADMDNQAKLDVLLELDLEVSIKTNPNPRNPDRPYVNVRLRRLIDGPMPYDSVRFPPTNGNGSNGDHEAVDGLDDTVEGVDFASTPAGQAPAEDPNDIPF